MQGDFSFYAELTVLIPRKSRLTQGWRSGMIGLSKKVESPSPKGEFPMDMKKRENVYWVIIVLLLIAIICSIVTGVSAKDTAPAPTQPTLAQEEAPSGPKVVAVETLVEVEKEITAATIQDGLRDMGTLITGEYYFTEVISYSSVKKLWGIALPVTESGYLASYDGVVTAGIDFSQIRVEKNEEARTIQIHLPKATIQNVDIDPESFTLHSEKTGLANPLSIMDFNSGLVELERSAQQKAISRGLLGKADANAQSVIRNFVTSLVGADRYTVNITL